MKIIMVVALSVSLIIIAYTAFGNDKNKQVNNIHVTSQSTAKWKSKAPQLFNKGEYGGLMESNTVAIGNTSISQAELVGNITNPFGIRDDILDYIIYNVPNDPKYALKATITLARNKQIIYYGMISESQALQLANQNSLIRWCLFKYLGQEKSFALTDQMNALLRNTEARDKHVWDVDTKLFGWKLIGSDLTGAEMDTACIKGDF